MISNLPWIVYRCNRMKPGELPTNEAEVDRAVTASEAMELADGFRRKDLKHSNTVGAA
ncbi:MAG: hypothetical protein NXI02_24980 [Rhodobacteraceae bacterium]|nr:hypothetical protein [Paracoccaceae bacterium]